MSYWFYKEDESGKQRLFAVDVPFPVIIMLFGMLGALFMPRHMHLHELVTDGSYLISVGFFFLIVSKISLFSKGFWISWGPKFMSKSFRCLYMVGYVFIGMGTLLILSIAGVK